MRVSFLSGDRQRTDSVVAIGSFDGIHLGHQKVLSIVTSEAASRAISTVAATFDPHPRVVLGGEAPSLVTTLDERRHLLAEVGIKRFAAIHFDKEIASMSPESFVEDILVNCMGAKVVVVGHDHRFGRDRAGDVDLLEKLGSLHGFDVIQCEPLLIGAKAVSSSRIRGLLDGGDVRGAATLLDRRYSFAGRVIHGAGRGKTIGIPTANISPLSTDKLIPGLGVYAVMTQLPGESFSRPGMMNIGRRPTFDGTGLHLEVNVLDWSGDLYEHEVRVEFVERIRDEQKFDGIDALLKQLNADRDRCRALLRDIS